MMRSPSAMLLELDSARVATSPRETLIWDFIKSDSTGWSSLMHVYAAEDRDRWDRVATDAQMQEKYYCRFHVVVSKNGHSQQITDTDSAEEGEVLPHLPATVAKLLNLSLYDRDSILDFRNFHFLWNALLICFKSLLFCTARSSLLVAYLVSSDSGHTSVSKNFSVDLFSVGSVEVDPILAITGASHSMELYSSSCAVIRLAGKILWCFAPPQLVLWWVEQ